MTITELAPEAPDLTRDQREQALLRLADWWLEFDDATLADLEPFFGLAVDKYMPAIVVYADTAWSKFTDLTDALHQRSECNSGRCQYEEEGGSCNSNRPTCLDRVDVALANCFKAR